jgi:hypothetical protein
MSTTSNMAVAVQYSLSAGSLLFKIKVDSFMTHGAGETFAMIEGSETVFNWF